VLLDAKHDRALPAVVDDLGDGALRATSNPYLWGALALNASLEALALGVPAMRDLLGLTMLDADAWLVAAGLATLPLARTRATRLLRQR